MSEAQKTLVLEAVQHAIDGMITDREMVRTIEKNHRRQDRGPRRRLWNHRLIVVAARAVTAHRPTATREREPRCPTSRPQRRKRKPRADLTAEEKARLAKYGR